MNQNWLRADLKARAKEAFRHNYWAAVAVSLILVLLTAGGGSGSGGRTYTTAQDTYDNYVDRNYYDHELQEKMGSIADSAKTNSLVGWGLYLLTSAVVITVAVVVLLFGIFVGNALKVGGCKFYIENLYSKPKIKRVFYGFTSGCYGNVIKVMFLKDLFTFLWSLLFVIPGIIKAYEYHMVPYLLAEYPDMTWQEASTRSREMMYGNKMDTFILEISFFPWHLLSAISGGIVGVFYVYPYIDATMAELYDTLAGPSQYYDGYHNYYESY